MQQADAGFTGYPGASPPNGHGTHHYHVVVHATDMAARLSSCSPVRASPG
ncbi:hypothetical protein E2F48_11620 [Arthrobacter crusticola]|uniref:YbhB/YbcL family Raf kinase inhibitor-like protein n=1 Tax=Arthrobacter crusticola TaxID=2547960 RepID=A0A4R5TXT0_9MICC|nr:YbhB/YbcL family Raf kinase inhibitor-like protein [Arthrobacter crusticola]TDK25938.1 hypothetical protein E2F48_11620 [Arthrobacter crusticola]